jgi:hypothetical protein
MRWVTTQKNKTISGHINHSVLCGLFAEQFCGQGFEDKNFETYWKSFAD